MRLFIILLALAYWGLASLAQSYLAHGGSNAPVTPDAADREISEPVIAETACTGQEPNELLVTASFSAGAAEETAPSPPGGLPSCQD